MESFYVSFIRLMFERSITSRPLLFVDSTDLGINYSLLLQQRNEEEFIMFKRMTAIIIIGLLLATSMPAHKVMASWAGYSTEELINEAEVILIGEIIEPAAEEKRSYAGSSSFWVTHWQVKVKYYLKGSLEFEELTVTTPGATNRSPMTSIDYRLDEWGKSVMLFLGDREGMLEPISPQGVVALSAKEYSSGPEEQVNGEMILKEYMIENPHINDPQILEDFINNKADITIPKPGLTDSYPSYTQTTTIVTLAALILLVISGLWVFTKRVKIY